MNQRYRNSGQRPSPQVASARLADLPCCSAAGPGMRALFPPSLSGCSACATANWQQIAPVSAEGSVFPSVFIGRPYHPGILPRRHLYPLAAKVGVPQLVWHTFRHTFCSWFDAVRTAVGVQQNRMRHADVTTTMNVYGKGMMEGKLEALTRLLEYAHAGFSGVANELALAPSY